MTTTMIPQMLTTHPYTPSVTPRYGFISTAETIAAFEAAEYTVTAAMTVRTRRNRLERAPYAKHMVRLRPANAPLLPGGTFPEVILINSFDGSSTFQLLAGLFRLVCSNGLVVTAADFGGIRLTHTTGKAAGALEAAKTMAETAGLIASKDIPAMLAKTMDRTQALSFAESLGTRFRPEDLVQVHRQEDVDCNLWTVFNVIQENLMRGGARPINFGQRRSRAIRSIKGTLDTNINLWQAAVAYLDQAPTRVA